MLDPDFVHSDTIRMLSHPAFVNGSHGWVMPNPDGRKASCGGPQVCRVCMLEKALVETSDRVVVMEGFVLKPGDSLLLIADPKLSPHYMMPIIDQLKKHFEDVDITVVQGFTGVQVHRQEPTK